MLRARDRGGKRPPRRQRIPGAYCRWLAETFTLSPLLRFALRYELRRREGKPRRKGAP
jgi:hypothetical protein